MSLTSGTRLGPYEIVAPIGAGGMGEVYRARDTRLDRMVAVKVLSAHLADTPDAKQRFEREARAVSALNHPHICALYDIGSQGGTEFLVMEYLEGQTLAARIEKGSLPIKELLELSVQIADALDKAHRNGVIHRDLKPSNIMLTKSGAKLVDFGLAKTVDLSLASGSTLAPSPNKSITEKGTIIGTFQYMSPEQIEGEELDARSDIFSFGAVLYEMATGRAAFSGTNRASIIAAILALEPPPISTLQPLTPPALDRAVRQCLAKNPEDRWQTARDLLLELKWISDSGSQAGAPATIGSRRKSRERVAWAVAAALAITAVALAIGFVQRAPKPAQPIRMNTDLGADATLPPSNAASLGSNAIISPDGSVFAFVGAGSDKKTRLYVRSLDQLKATALSGTEDARDPFFSPDGKWIAFFSSGKLKKISAQGGAVATLCDVGEDRSGTWGDNGTIVFSGGFQAALSKVSSAGGTPEPYTTLDKQKGEVTHHWPQFLPGGEIVIFTSINSSSTNFYEADICVYSEASRKYETIVQKGAYGRYLPSGHLVFIRNGTLFAAPFDVKRLKLTGQPVPVVEGVASNPDNGGAQFSFSDSGTFLYIARAFNDAKFSIYWMDSAGHSTALPALPGDYRGLAVSPDGNRFAMTIESRNKTDIWVYEWKRDSFTRLTVFGDGESAADPFWTPDGQRVTYTFTKKGAVSSMWWIRADGSGEPQRLLENDLPQSGQSWSPDGKVLAFNLLDPSTKIDLFTVSVDGSENAGWKIDQPKPFVKTSFAEVHPMFSPDGHWIAYASNESGKFEVYVRPFPGPGGRWQISTDGGGYPAWSPNGKDFFYLTNDQKLMVVGYSSSGETFRAEKPHPWWIGPANDPTMNGGYSLNRDGKRIAVLKAAEADASPAPINKASFIFNFFDELRAKVPTGKN